MKGIEGLPFKYIVLILSSIIILAAFFYVLNIYKVTSIDNINSVGSFLNNAIDKNLESVLKR
ncbi:MAG TPA: hypothetical protein VJH90_01895 [archaeon]|nr:hypothetical protein [archaeon]